MGKTFGSFIVHIEKTENDVLEGWFMNPYIQEYVAFHDLGVMVLKMDESLRWLMEKEEQGELHEMAQCHSFRDFTFPPTNHPRFCYQIQILYTSYHSWQGLIAGTNRPRTTFKSTLDCIHKLNQAIMGHQTKKKSSANKG